MNKRDDHHDPIKENELNPEKDWRIRSQFFYHSLAWRLLRLVRNVFFPAETLCFSSVTVATPILKVVEKD